MNNKGQSILGSIIIGIVLFMFGMLFVGFLDLEVDNAVTDLNCGTPEDPNLSISDGAKATCLLTEVAVPYFIIMVISAAGGIIIARFVL